MGHDHLVFHVSQGKEYIMEDTNLLVLVVHGVRRGRYR
jgi:hypothetical protein